MGFVPRATTRGQDDFDKNDNKNNEDDAWISVVAFSCGVAALTGFMNGESWWRFCCDSTGM